MNGGGKAGKRMTLAQETIATVGLWLAAVAIFSPTIGVGAIPVEEFSTATGAQQCADILVAEPPNSTPAMPPGSLPTDAGAHHDACLAIQIAETAAENPDGRRVGQLRTIDIGLPPGLYANPLATGGAQCDPRLVSAAAGSSAIYNCPQAAQVGVAGVWLQGTQWDLGGPPIGGGIYMVDPGRDLPARLAVGFGVLAPLVSPALVAKTDTDFGILNLTAEVSSGLPVRRIELYLWGVPNANIRGGLPLGSGFLQCPGAAGEGGECSPTLPPDPLQDLRSFWTNPTSCDGPKTVTLDTTYYPIANLPNISGETFTDESVNPMPTNCQDVPFDPALDIEPTSHRSDDASGLEAELSFTQTTDPNHLGTSHLRRAEVVLPKGFNFNPSAGDGLGACTDEQFGFGVRDAAHCPDASKIGSIDFDVPLIPEPLHGDLFLGEPLTNDPQSDGMYRIFQYSQERSLFIKIPGYTKLDPRTGQITAVFERGDEVNTGLPQAPIRSFSLHFKGGPRGAVATPQTCGTHRIDYRFEGWSGAIVNDSDTFEITSGPDGTPASCVSNLAQRPFGPQVSGGTVEPKAGAFSPFVLSVLRRDGEQELTGLELNMPPGLLADLSKTPSCPEGAIAQAGSRNGIAEQLSPSCPAASRIGVASVGAGAGSQPLFVDGSVYLGGPYDPDGAGPAARAPLSAVVITPAVAGPFDLGVVLVRSPIYVDPASALVRIGPTRIPHIFGGIPLRAKDIRVRLDKPDFTLNPTNCDPLALSGELAGSGGVLEELGDNTTSAFSNRFQVGGCENLGFKPKLSLRLKGGTKRSQYPALTATLTARPGDANIGRVSVALPHSEFLAQEHIRTICTRPQFAADQCPAGSVYGYAEAITPLLKDPIAGPVYLRSSDNPLPDMVVALRGPESQPIEIELAGRTDSVNAGLRNTFDVVPDAPVSRFTLKLQGGKKGLLVNSTNICATTKVVRKGERKVKKKVPARNFATADFTAQNGKALTQKAPVKAVDCKKGKKKKAKRAERRRGIWMTVGWRD